MGFLRPNGMQRTLTVEQQTSARRTVGSQKTGETRDTFTAVGTVTGWFSEASPREIEQFQQSGHPITHQLVGKGAPSPLVRQGSIVRLDPPSGSSTPPRRLVVQMPPENAAELGLYTLYRLLERPDLVGEVA